MQTRIGIGSEPPFFIVSYTSGYARISIQEPCYLSEARRSLRAVECGSRVVALEALLQWHLRGLCTRGPSSKADACIEVVRQMRHLLAGKRQKILVASIAMQKFQPMPAQLSTHMSFVHSERRYRLATNGLHEFHGWEHDNKL